MYDLYQCNDDDTARFILGKNGKRKLFVVGLNPSTANKENSDTTVAKVETVARNNGYDGFVMSNLYPLRSTNPNGLPSEVDTLLFQTNIDKIIAIAGSEESPVFWAAWGGDITLRPYLAEALRALVVAVESLNGQWVNFGKLSQDGHPRHPSRLAYAWSFAPFEVNTYVRRFA